MVRLIPSRELDALQDALSQALDFCSPIALIGAQRAWDMMAERRAEAAGTPFHTFHQETMPMPDDPDRRVQEPYRIAFSTKVTQERAKLHARLMPVAAQILAAMQMPGRSIREAQARMDAKAAISLAMILDQEMTDACDREARRLITVLESIRDQSTPGTADQSNV